MKFSAFLSCVEVIKCVKFQISRLMGFKVGIFRISPISFTSPYRLVPQKTLPQKKHIYENCIREALTNTGIRIFKSHKNLHLEVGVDFNVSTKVADCHAGEMLFCVKVFSY